MRRCYLVCYDIRNAKRLRRVFKTMKGYGQHWQFSIFFCVLKDIDRVRMQTSLEAEMNLKEDQVLVVDLGANEQDARKAATIIGQSLPQAYPGTVVV
jgi:CRISPR-associated protein Cas2